MRRGNRRFWVNGAASSTTADATASSEAFAGDAVSISAGVDQYFGDEWRAGLAYSYGDGDFERASSLSDVHNSHAISGYLGYDSGGLYGYGAAGYSFNSHETQRAVFRGEVVSASLNSRAFIACAEIGYQIPFGG